MFFSPRFLTYGQEARVNIEDGALLRNLRGINGPLFVVGNPFSGPNLEFDLPSVGKTSTGCILHAGGKFLPLGTVPMMIWPSGSFILFADSTSGIAGGGSTFVHIDSGATFVIDFDGNSEVSDGWAEGPIGSSIIYNIDASVVLPSIPAFFGTVTINLESNASRTAYTPASSANWNNNPPTTVAAALDRIAAHAGPIP